MDIPMVLESLKFMVLGMTVVFVFLVILVQAMKLQAYVIGKYFPDKAPEAPAASGGQSDDEQSRVAAVIAAVADYRKNRS